VRIVACPTCRNAVQIGGDADEIRNLLRDEKSFKCVTPLCRGRMLPMGLADLKGQYEMSEMPVKSFFRAINGFGTGNGAPASRERLTELLLSQRVVDVVAYPIGQPERVIVREMTLESGIRLHFESSARGACVYYIEEPGPSCREVVENELATSASAEGDAANREEVGRGTQAADEIEPLDIWSNEPAGPSSGANGLQDAKRVSSVPASSGVPTGGVSGPSGHRGD